MQYECLIKEYANYFLIMHDERPKSAGRSFNDKEHISYPETISAEYASSYGYRKTMSRCAGINFNAISLLIVG